MSKELQQERSGVGRRADDTPHCDAHLMNTASLEQLTTGQLKLTGDLTTLSTTVATMFGSQKNTRYWVQVGLPVMTLIVSAFCIMLRSDVSDLKKDVSTHLGAINTTIMNAALANRALEIEVQQLKRDVEEMQGVHRRQ